MCEDLDQKLHRLKHLELTIQDAQNVAEGLSYSIELTDHYLRRAKESLAQLLVALQD